MYSVTSSNHVASFLKTLFSFAKFQQNCMICQLKLVFYLLEFYSRLIRITVHFSWNGGKRVVCWFLFSTHWFIFTTPLVIYASCRLLYWISSFESTNQATKIDFNKSKCILSTNEWNGTVSASRCLFFWDHVVEYTFFFFGGGGIMSAVFELLVINWIILSWWKILICYL